jgi:hypothetical protein
MSESTLDRLRQEVKKKELERKAKAFRREQIEKERMEQVRLTRVIYVDPLLHTHLQHEKQRFLHKNKEVGNWKKN